MWFFVAMNTNFNKLNKKKNDEKGKRQKETQVHMNKVNDGNKFSSFQAIGAIKLPVVAKYCIAWQEIKHYPGTCKYFEATESQLVWLIIHSGFIAKQGCLHSCWCHDWPCHSSCMKKQWQEAWFFQLYYKSHTGCYKDKKKILLQ